MRAFGAARRRSASSSWRNGPRSRRAAIGARLFGGVIRVFAEVWGLQSSRAGVTVTELREMGLLEVVQGGNQNSSGGLYRLNRVEELRAAYLAASGLGGSLSEQAAVGRDGEEEDAGPVEFGYWQIACPRHGEMSTPTGNCPTCVREGWSNG